MVDDAVVPVVGTVFGVLMVIVIVVSKHRRDLRELELRHRERMAAIEKGLELPPDPPSAVHSGTASDRERTHERGGSRYLLRGLIWLGVGMAIALSTDAPTYKLHPFGWIAAAIGAAYLIFYFLEGRQGGSPPGSHRNPP